MLSFEAKMRLDVGIAGEDVLGHRQALGAVPLGGLLGHDLEAATGQTFFGAIGARLRRSTARSTPCRIATSEPAWRGCRR